jgi:hypothetical protein
MFDMNNPNIYKGIIPTIGVGAAIQKKSKGGKINKNNMAYFNYKGQNLQKIRSTYSTPTRLANGGSTQSNYDIDQGFNATAQPSHAGYGRYNNDVNTNFNWGNVGTGALSGFAAGISTGNPWIALGTTIAGAATGAYGSKVEQEGDIANYNARDSQIRYAKGMRDKNRQYQFDKGIGTNQNTVWAAKGGKLTHTMPDGTVMAGATHVADNTRVNRTSKRPKLRNDGNFDVITAGDGATLYSVAKTDGRARMSDIRNFNYDMNLDGDISGKTLGIPTKTRKVGAGIEVKGKKGTDTINATVGGQPVKLDNEEIIVNYQGSPVVISDDLGEADAYRTALKNGGNPKEVADYYAKRAIQLNPNPSGNSRYLGGYGDDKRYLDSDVIPNNRNYLGNPISGIDPNRPSNVQMNDKYLKIIANRNVNNPASVDNISVPPPDTYSKIGSRKFTGNLTEGITSNSPNDIASATNFIQPNVRPNTNITPPTDSRADFREKMQGIDGNTAARGLGFLATTVGNINAAYRLSKTRPAPFKPAQPAQLNPDANRPIFNDQISTIRRGSRNLGTQILGNTASSSTALARLGGVEANRIGAEGTVNSQRVADRNQIMNRNTDTTNRVGLYNNQGLNNQNRFNYQDQLGRISTQNALVGSTVSSLENVIDNVEKGNYQDEMLQAVAMSYGVKLSKNATAEDYLKALKGILNNQLNTQFST